MPGALQDYARRLPLTLHVMQVENTYLWERHVTIKAFWRLLLQGRGPGETSLLVHLLTAITALPFAAGLFLAARRARRAAASTDPLVASAVVTAPLLMPFYFDYDLLLLALPAVLNSRSNPPPRSVALWAALYVWLFLNPYVAGAIRVNFVVPLVASVASLLLRRALLVNVERASDPTVFTTFQPPLASSRKAA
jgi:hypothetical protein